MLERLTFVIMKSIGSAMGYMILLTEGFREGSGTKANVLSWRSVKTKRIVASTYDAETLALTTALEEAVFIREQLCKMLNLEEDVIKIEAFCDCRDTCAAVNANKPMPNQNSRLAALEVARIIEMKQLGMLYDLKWISTKIQMADCLTKRGACVENMVKTISRGEFTF